MSIRHYFITSWRLPRLRCIDCWARVFSTTTSCAKYGLCELWVVIVMPWGSCQPPCCQGFASTDDMPHILLPAHVVTMQGYGRHDVPPMNSWIPRLVLHSHLSESTCTIAGRNTYNHENWEHACINQITKKEIRIKKRRERKWNRDPIQHHPRISQLIIRSWMEGEICGLVCSLCRHV